MVLMGYIVLLFYVLHSCDHVHGVHSLASISVASVIHTSCLENMIVEVSIINSDYASFNLSGDHGLSLLHRDCQPESNGTHSVWRFSEGKCGSKTVFSGYGKITIVNVLLVTSKSDKHWDPLFVDTIACTFSESFDVMPKMEWTFYRGSKDMKDYENSSLVDFGASSIPVSKWEEGNWVHAAIQPEEPTVVKEMYDGNVLVTVESCSLEMETLDGGVDTKTLFENGCPETKDQFFGDTPEKPALTAEGVRYIFNLRKAAQLHRGNAVHVQYARLICNVTLCADGHGFVFMDGSTPSMPECQWYYREHDPTCAHSLKDVNPDFVQTLRSEWFVIQEQVHNSKYSKSTFDKMSTTPLVYGTETSSVNKSKAGSSDRSYPMRVDITATEPEIVLDDTNKEDAPMKAADMTVILNLPTTVIVCLACFFCGGSMVATFWLLQSHRRRMLNSMRSGMSSPTSDVSINLTSEDSESKATVSTSIDISNSAA